MNYHVREALNQLIARYQPTGCKIKTMKNEFFQGFRKYFTFAHLNTFRDVSNSF